MAELRLTRIVKFIGIAYAIAAAVMLVFLIATNVPWPWPTRLLAAAFWPAMLVLWLLFAFRETDD